MGTIDRVSKVAQWKDGMPVSSWGDQPCSPAGQGSKSTKEGTLGKTGQTEAMEGFQRCRRAAGRMRAGVPGKNVAATERVMAKPR